MRFILLALIAIFPMSAGCSAEKRMAREPTQRADAPGDFVGKKDEKGPAGREPDAPGAEKKDKAEPPRKIRYTADLRLIVDDFTLAEQGLEGAIKDAKGMLKSSEISQVSGGVRTGTWRIRVPVDNFNTFRAAVAKLGDVERNTVDSEDLTAQYYDLDAHIKNRLAERDAIRDLLKEVGKQNLKHFLEIKRELDAINDDINRKEGQLKLWANLTDLTTITVQMREKQKYLAEKKVEEKETPTFGTRAGKVWGDSLTALVDFVQALAIVAIAVTPWLPFPLVVLMGCWLLVRRLSRSSKAVASRSAPKPPPAGEEPSA